jgi:hypothetical protein
LTGKSAAEQTCYLKAIELASGTIRDFFELAYKKKLTTHVQAVAAKN